MIMRQTVDITIDFKKEVARLRACFGGEVLKRQLHLIRLAKRMDIDQLIMAYNQLPYNERNECPEQEFVGEYINHFWPRPGYTLGEVTIGPKRIKKLK